MLLAMCFNIDMQTIERNVKIVVLFYHSGFLIPACVFVGTCCHGEDTMKGNA